MPWTHIEIIDKHDLPSGAHRINVRFSTDEKPAPRTFEVPIDIPPGAAADLFDRTVKRFLETLEARDLAKALADQLTPGPYTPKAGEPVPTPEPTPEDLARRQFLDKVEKLQKLRGVLRFGDPDLTALEEEVAAELKAHPEYVDSL